MAGIKNYSTVAANNNAAPPNGWPEDMFPNQVNNSARQNMADTRSFYESASWTDLGHTVTYTSATTFTIDTDVTAYYTANRRIQCTDATTLYGYIASSSYVSPNTTVTVVLDSGSLSASLSAVAVGLIDPTNYPVPAEGLSGALTNVTIDNVVIGGTTPAAGSFTTLSASSGINNTTIGSTTAAAGSFTTGAFSGSVTSSKSVPSGYTRISPNFFYKTNPATSSIGTTVSGSHFNETAPTGASYVLVKINSYAKSANTTGARNCYVQDDNGNDIARAQTYEATAVTANTVLSVNSGIAILPVSSGTFSITSYGDLGGYSVNEYSILGGFD